MVMAVLNLVVSILLVQRIGFWGAAIGTAASLLLGHGVLMNIYYAKTFHMEVLRMFREIFAGILPSGLLASLVCLPLALFLPDTVLWFVLKCCFFVLIYALLLFVFGLNSSEKSFFRSIFRKFLPK
jgi:O-antigen/teichoic acid export membrane protein